MGDLPVIGDAVGIPVHTDRTVKGAFAGGIEVFQLVVVKLPGVTVVSIKL